jgi:teichuronic acid biosynthesis glycosyltransferase TuaC
VEVFAFPAGSPAAYAGAAARAARDHRGRRFDVVHAHFGLSAWPALGVRATVHGITLHGTDLAHPRSRAITLAALRAFDVVGVASEALAEKLPGWAVRGRAQTLPCGVDTGRFHPIPRDVARGALGLRLEGPVVLFAADPARSEKRFDRARAVAGDTPILTLGSVDPERVPLYVNAANAVLVPSEREGFGLAVLEALACQVPVLATPVGIAPQALAGLPDVLCAEFEAERWSLALRPLLRAEDPRVAGGRERAERWSSSAMAERIAGAWSRAVADSARRSS